MNASAIIEAFGGASAVAARFGATRTAVCNWRHAGIPARFWLAMVNTAAAEGIDGVTPEAVAWRPATAEAAA